MQTMRQFRTGGIKSDGRFKTLRSYIATDGMPVRKEFNQRKGETPRQVIARADAWVAEMKGKVPTPTMALSVAIELFHESREDDDLADVTIKDDKFVGGILKEWLGAQRIDRIDAYSVELVLKAHAGKPRTAKKLRDFGRKLYKWIIKRGWYDSNPFQMAKAPRYEPETWDEPMTAEHFTLALHQMPREDQKALFLLLRWSGIRPKAARTLLRAELLDEDGQLWIRKITAKNKWSKKPIPVPRAAAEAIRALPVTSLYVFPSWKTGRPYSERTVMDWWKDAQLAAKLEPVSVYMLKHLRITEMSKHFDSVEIAASVGVRTTKVIDENYRQIARKELALKIERHTCK